MMLSCDAIWDEVEAAVVCRQAGFSRIGDPQLRVTVVYTLYSTCLEHLSNCMCTKVIILVCLVVCFSFATSQF